MIQIGQWNQKEILPALTVGATVLFGSYWQRAERDAGKEAVLWKVLAKEDTSVLLISQYALDYRPYHNLNPNLTWENSCIRQWLNGRFMADAFCGWEKNLIQDPAGREKIFLLSVGEAARYFYSDEARKCAPTAYAAAQGLLKGGYMADRQGTCCWWLRWPGYSSCRAIVIDRDGSANCRYGYQVNRINYAIRPALWIKLGV